MQLSSMHAENYRSLRSIRMDLARVNVFVGENGVGKSNLYRALQLVQEAANGSFAAGIAHEGGMSSALWSGPRRADKLVRIRLSVELVDHERAITFRYRIEAGLTPPVSAGFAFEPQIKEEELLIEAGRSPVTVMKRTGPSIHVRGETGRMEAHGEDILPSETALALLGDAGHHPEIGALRRAVLGWRFYHGFRTDRDSPLRRPALAVTSPMLDEDGGNMAAVFATLRHIRGESPDLDRAVAEALSGARLDVPPPERAASFALVLPGFEGRPFQPEELSDGQLRFLAFAAALLSYRRPRFIALNEPETSLHPAMLPALARMIAEAARESQVWIVTHSRELADAIEKEAGVRPRRVVRKDGATWIEGLRISGEVEEE
jgi:Predicted ATPase